MMKRDYSVEVIEDSEPERQQQRELIYEQRRKDRADKKHIPASSDAPIIEISDDESLYGSRLATTIELSDDPRSFYGPSLPILSQAKPALPPKLSSIKLSESHKASEARCENSNQSVGNPPSVTTNEDSLSPSRSKSTGSRVLDLQHFGFIPTQPSRASTSAPSIISSHQPIPLTRTPSNTTRRPHVSDYSFTDSQLQKLTRCVCCQIPWTTRKGARGKLNHIQKCARKSSLTEHAVQLMIEQDLQALATQRDLKKGKCKAVAPEPATLLEGMVADATTKTKGRKKEIPTTVLQVAETHQAILSRARALFEESEESDIPSFPATQGFAPSKLGRNLQPHPKVTQSFQKSRLGTSRRVPGFGDSDDEASDLKSPSPARSSSPLPPRSPSPQNSILSQPSERCCAKGKHRTLRRELRQSLFLHSGAEDQLQNELDCPFRETPSGIADSWGDWNDGVIEWTGVGPDEKTVPELRASPSPSPSPSRIPATKLAAPSTRRLYPHSYVPRMSFSAQSPSPLPFGRPISPPRRSPARKRRPCKTKIITTTEGRASPGVALQSAADDDLFEVVMLTAIKANTELYHKVLRYEPVDFNVFLYLAIGHDLPTKKLMWKLRTFLDQQTIHFCGPSESRTARY